ncbi:DUF4880 domain-containing protein [Methylomonas sp. LW13]|uniref:FecR domain-containing protein n=1 Tax=unclassified Methylomonas TaxID=2608980 RepID=UPI0006912AC1|nr:FecR domain-containing protein [Methylomonas sp. LW13]QBC27589.1 DUF4880 domain-containing protein [Methylomonas sp. LW13]
MAKRHHPDIHPRILAEAAEWFAVLGSGATSQTEQQQWQAWLASHPAHRAAWSRVEFFTHKFDGLPTQTAAAALGSPDMQRRQALKNLAILAAVGLSGFELWRSDYLSGWRADYRTGIGTTRSLSLADGSRIEMDAASAIDVDFSTDLRRIRLLSGEIYIETAPDSNGRHRPFVVDSAEGRVRAIGTRFSVHQQHEESQTSVYAGAVEITPSGPGASRQTLSAGQQAQFNAQAIAPIQATELNQPAWTQGFLLVDNQPLGEFVVQLNRYRHGYITCAPEIAELRIVGAYPIHDTDRILAELEKTLPVKVSQVSPLWVRIERR